MDLNNVTERNITAGEYVLGTLTAAERREVEGAAEQNMVLRHEIYRWERQLAGIGLGLRALPPRPLVWFEIAQRMGPAAVIAAPTLWKAWAGLATGAALVLAVSLAWQMTRPPPQPVTITERIEVPVAASSFVATLAMPKSAMAWSVSLTPERKSLSVRAEGQAPKALTGKDAQLWWIADTGPVSLGLMPSAGEMRGTLPPGPDYSLGGTVAVSLEPPGGSPEPGPTGPVVATAQLLKAG